VVRPALALEAGWGGESVGGQVDGAGEVLWNSGHWTSCAQGIHKCVLGS
jgi:hypothetical protein